MDDSDPAWRRACAVVLLLTALAFAVIFDDYGITWDEGVQATYGELVLDYFISGGRDLRAIEYENLYYYGPLFETIAAATYRAAGRFEFEIRHALIGLTALLTLVAVWRFAIRLGSGAVACFAMVALAVMPRFLGHAFNNSKDIPFACAFAWGMVGIARLLSRERWRWIDVLLCAAAVGAALAIRVGGVILLAMLAVGVAGQLLLSNDGSGAWRRRMPDRLLKLAAVALLAWLAMIAIWPWAHGDPLARPLRALSEMSGFSLSYPVYFQGEILRSDALPRYYLPLYLTIVTPLTLLGLTGWGLVASVRDQLARPRDPRSLLLGLLQLWLLLPILFAVVKRPNMYDGIRHFLFLLPAIALLAGVGSTALLRQFGGNRLGRAILAAALLASVPALIGLHPYQSSYFNALAGGLNQAWRSYDTDYWASSYREATRWLLDQAPAGAPLTVAVACNSHNRPCAAYYAETAGPDAPRVSLYCVWNGDEQIPPDAAYFIGMLRYGKAGSLFPDWPVVHSIGRHGAVFSVIKRNPAHTGAAP